MTENEKPVQERLSTVTTPSGKVRVLHDVHPDILSGAGRMRVIKKAAKKADEPTEESDS